MKTFLLKTGSQQKAEDVEVVLMQPVTRKKPKLSWLKANFDGGYGPVSGLSMGAFCYLGFRGKIIDC